MRNYQWQKVTFKNSSGLRLAGLFYTAGIEGSPALVVCHGFTGSKEGAGKAVQMAEFYGAVGYDVLLFDFACNGESQGNFEDLTLSGQIDDLTCAVDWCQEQGAGTIITTGRSFGGTTVICHAARDKRVAGVCTWAASTNLTQRLSELAVDDPDDPKRVLVAGDEGILYLKKGFFQDLGKYDVLLLASQIAPRPLLLIHGTKDDMVPLDDAKSIYESAGETKELVIIEGGDHQFTAHYQQVWDICANWLKNFL